MIPGPSPWCSQPQGISLSFSNMKTYSYLTTFMCAAFLPGPNICPSCPQFVSEKLVSPAPGNLLCLFRDLPGFLGLQASSVTALTPLGVTECTPACLL